MCLRYADAGDDFDEAYSILSSSTQIAVRESAYQFCQSKWTNSYILLESNEPGSRKPSERMLRGPQID